MHLQSIILKNFIFNITKLSTKVNTKITMKLMKSLKPQMIQNFGKYKKNIYNKKIQLRKK